MRGIAAKVLFVDLPRPCCFSMGLFFRPTRILFPGKDELSFVQMRAKRFRLGLAVLTLPAFIQASSLFIEAPELHRQVEARTLPPLENRLPVAPLVISPVERPGEYGGTWRMVVVGYNNYSVLFRSLAYEHLVRWDPNWTRVVPNVASSWTVNADATVYRFQLRHGMRWSDGEPYTARDIVAWMEDVARDAEITPEPLPWLTVGGCLPECSAPDDYTVEFRFAAPNGLFLEHLASVYSSDLTHYPAHYFRQMHPRYNPAGAADLAHRTGLPWAAAFRNLCTLRLFRDAGIPTIDAWSITDAYLPGAASVGAVRNPYYWKVDTQGRQLPYLNRVRFDVVADNEESLQRALDGKVDYQRQDFANINAAAGPALVAAEKAGRIGTVRVISARSNPIAICLNITHRDAGMRAALGNRNVRIALSEAIDRPALIRELYGYDVKPWQLAPRPMSPFCNRRLGEQYTDFAPERSKQLLDEAGLKMYAADGHRHLPDGRLFEINILAYSPLGSPNWPVILDQLKRNWQAVGVTMRWTVVPFDDFFYRLSMNQHDGAIMKGPGGYAAILEPDYFVPFSFESPNQIYYAIPWARWLNDPQSYGAEKPPESVISQMNVFRKILVEPDRDIRARLMTEVVTMAAQEFYAMGICLEPDRLAVRSPGFRNVPASHFDSWIYPDPGPFNPCQFYKDKTAAAE